MINQAVNQSLDTHTIACSIAALKAIIFDMPAANQAKIEFIKEELSAGRYQINTTHIASKLLEYAPVREETEMA